MKPSKKKTANDTIIQYTGVPLGIRNMTVVLCFGTSILKPCRASM